tara:strand:- start:21 stop:1058 length:1038 start_codon:yes stop_codon:yes gene_type:complete
MRLWNNLNKEELEIQLQKHQHKYVTISFYKYAKIKNPELFRDHLYLMWSNINVVGRTYIATEGINAQIAVPSSFLNQFSKELYEIKFLNGVRLNYSIEDSEAEFSFLKLKIKVRAKILADGLNDSTFDVTNKGVHLKAKEFNELIDSNNSLLIDMRNHYESEIGHFKGAVRPDVDTFRDSLEYIEDSYLKGNEDKKIVMYCTGGIRCEKASAWYKHKGYKHVYQLEGGIIKYARDAQAEGIENKFIGKNFVFDERRSERITDEVISLCHQCGVPADTHVNCENQACHLLFIQCEKCKTKFDSCCSKECSEIIKLPIEEQKMLRKGINKSNKIFKKGRSEKLTYKS